MNGISMLLVILGIQKENDSSRLNDKNDTKEFVVEIVDWNRDLSFPKRHNDGCF